MRSGKTLKPNSINAGASSASCKKRTKRSQQLQATDSVEFLMLCGLAGRTLDRCHRNVTRNAVKRGKLRIKRE